MAEIDVELALLDFPQDELSELDSALPPSYEYEEKYKLGWGAVIRTSVSLPDSVDDAVRIFLEGLDQSARIISEYDGVLRIAIYYDTVTLTYRLSSIELLNQFSLDIEVSAYPSAES